MAPTPGRIVLYWPLAEDMAGPLPAIVVRVHEGDRERADLFVINVKADGTPDNFGAPNRMKASAPGMPGTWSWPELRRPAAPRVTLVGADGSERHVDMGNPDDVAYALGALHGRILELERAARVG